MELSIGCGIAAMFCWGTADFIQGLAIRDIGTAMAMMLRNVLTLIISLSLGAALFWQGALEASTTDIFIIVLSSFVYVFGYLYYMRGFEFGKAAVVAPIASAYAIVTVLLSILFNDESVSATQAFAITLMILGVVAVSSDWREFRSIGHQAGVREASTALLFFGVAFYLAGFASQSMAGQEAFFYSALSQSIVFLVCSILIGARLRNIGAYRSVLVGTFLIHAVLVNGAWVAYLVGTSTGNISIVAPISSVFSGVTAILAIVVTHERLAASQYLGILLIMGGVFTASV
jgi:uncharacterized membrane protein